MLAASLRSVITIRQVEVDGTTIQIEAEGATAGAVCPACGQTSRRIHDRYCRRPADLPWHGHTIRLIIAVRSFCCDSASCPRATFVEGFGDALPRRARWTREAAQFLQHVANVAGGEAGARVAAAAGVVISADTLLRMQHDRRSAAAEPMRHVPPARNDGRPLDDCGAGPSHAGAVRHRAVPVAVRSPDRAGATAAHYQMSQQPRAAGSASS